MFSLGIRYLTGYAVATDVSDRQRAEWPPHPARVFMAMAAAHFETGECPTERDAMQWLERQGPPSAMHASEALHRSVVTHYVPVNDSSLPDKVKDCLKGETLKAGLSVLPQHRLKQPRVFPRVRPCEDTVYLIWPDVTADEKSIEILDGVCGKVIRVGHSASLVQMWIERNPPGPNWLADEAGDLRVRVIGTGTLDYLKAQFNAGAIQGYADLQSSLASATGKSRTAIKQEITERFPGGEPATRRPAISLWQTYRLTGDSGDTAQAACGAFDPTMMILTLQDGPVVGLETTWQLLTALRDTILSLCSPTPEWISGHLPDGSPSQDVHMALLPLAFVGHSHADGHLLGVALAFPKAIPSRQRGAALRKLLYDDAGRSKPVELKLGALGTWSLVRETRESPPLALQSQIWTGPSRTWATITPIVLDRHPKSDYAKQRDQWCQEVAKIIAEGCRRQGLPEPVNIDVDKTCWHRGALRAIPGKGGFVLMPTKTGQPARQQVHAWLRFDQDVEGPLLLGAGRYRGYGLCKPFGGGDQ